MTIGSREDLFASAKPIDDTERLIGRVLAGKFCVKKIKTQTCLLPNQVQLNCDVKKYDIPHHDSLF